MPEVSLAEGLSELSRTMLAQTGSDEHGQIWDLLRRARRHRLSPSAVAAVDVVAATAPWSIEHNLDAIAHPADAPLWIEFEDAPRRRDGMAFEGREVDRVGYLFAASPANAQAVVAVVAWRLATGSVHHAYGLVHWDRRDLAVHAAAARHRYSRVAVEARARMMALFNVATPLRFQRMVEELHSGEDPRVVEASLADGRLAGSGEMVFAFGALALLASDAPRSVCGEAFELVEAGGGRRGRLDRICDRVLRRPVPSFRRGGPTDAPSIGFAA